jgi:hypothetical protein
MIHLIFLFNSVCAAGKKSSHTGVVIGRQLVS